MAEKREFKSFEFVSHLPEFRQAMDAATQKAVAAIRGMMESNAKQIITNAVYNAPETWYKRTGLLRNSITTDAAEDKGDLCIVVGTNVSYAPFVELGTGVYAEDGKGRKDGWAYTVDGETHFTRGMVPRPFLRPAVEEHAKEYKTVIERELRSAPDPTA